VRSWYVDPLVETPKDAIPANAAMAVDAATGEPAFDAATGEPAVVARFPDVAASYFLSGVAVGLEADRLADRIQQAPALSTIHGFDTQVVMAGDVLRVPIQSDGPVAAFVTSVKTRQYFDFVAYDALDNLTSYSQRKSVPGLLHSGDIGALLHVLQFDQPARIEAASRIVLGVVGFKSTALASFVDQVPFVCIPNYAARTVYEAVARSTYSRRTNFTASTATLRCSTSSGHPVYGYASTTAA